MSEHPKDCPWHYDYHACSCGKFDQVKQFPCECEYYKGNKISCVDCLSKWYNCAKCDAGYEDQECTCEKG